MSSLLPMWLRLVWAMLLCIVVVVHIGHAVVMRGQRRWWHAVHTVMAAGMMLMFLLPGMRYPNLHHAGLVFFALLSVGLAVATGLIWRREGALNTLWAVTVLDMAVMASMFIPVSSRPALFTYAMVLYLGAQTLAWILGWWSRTPYGGRVAERVPAGGGDDVTETPPAVRTRLLAPASPNTRATLAVMASSMAYMLAAM